ncbi:hypothetical protein KI688_000702 [Linnemannia hyalina]|uniref:Uncharacterized protein n=1 Tax=Linnemannia hyalina TaxID=64524 RepID=A0A9P7Y532_9FUNG|nr:hypothetical protein KI688_000702 [Linnemannia hyalina]
MHGVDMTLEEREHFLTEVHPRSTRELTLWALDVAPQLLQTFFLPPTHLTSLELYWKPTTIMRSSVLAYSNLQELAHASGLVHQYLCESDYLVHLTTLKTAIQHEDLDLFSRAAYVDLDKGFDNRTLQETTFQHLSSAPRAFASPSSPPSLPVVWRCRGLHTLHIEVLCPKKYLFEHPVQNRIVYGYISRVCPLLKDLEICLPHDDQPNAGGCLDLKAGLWLLLDVEEMINEMDVEECQLLPNLERLSFKYPIMLRPEEELRLWPGTMARFVARQSTNRTAEEKYDTKALLPNVGLATMNQLDLYSLFLHDSTFPPGHPGTAREIFLHINRYTIARTVVLVCPTEQPRVVSASMKPVPTTMQLLLCPVCSRAFKPSKNQNTNLRRHLQNIHNMSPTTHPRKCKWDSIPDGRVKDDKDRKERTRKSKRLSARKTRPRRKAEEAALGLCMLSQAV